MANTVASLIVEIDGDDSGLQSTLRNVNRELNNFSLGGALQDVGRNLTSMGARVSLATAPIAAGFVKGIKVASDFESVMREIQARTGLTTSEMTNISDAAIQMGADTSFSAQQAGEAFLQLLTSGQTVNEALQTLPTVLDAAAASGEGLGMTADMITDIMAAYNLEVDQAASVSDALARAAGASSADIASLGQGFKNVGPVAKRFGIGVDKSAAILAVLSENGIKGAEAGTALKSMLLNMTRTTDEVQAAWDELGTSFYDAQGAARPLEDVLYDINIAMMDMPAEEQNRLMKDLFGSYGIVAGSALLGALSIEDMAAMMEMQADASTVAKARMDTFAGAMESLQGSVETLMIRALTPFMNDVLKPMVQDLITVVNGVTDWVTQNPELTGQIIKLAAGAVILGPALIAAGIGFTILGTAVSGLGAAIGLLLSPIGLVALAAVGLGLAWGTNFGGIQDKTREAVNAIKPKLEELKTALDSVTVDPEATRNNILTKLNNLFGAEIFMSKNSPGDQLRIALEQDLANKLPAIFGTNNTPFDQLRIVIMDKIDNALFKLQGITIEKSGINAWATDNMNAILDTVVAVAGIVLGGPIGMTIGAARLIASAIENDFLGLGTFIKTSGIEAAVNDAISNIRTIVEGAFANFNLFGGGGGGGMLSPEEMLIQGYDLTSTGGNDNPIVSVLTNFFEEVKGGLEAFSPELKESFEQIKNGIVGFIDEISKADTSGLETIFATLLSVALKIAGIAGAIIGVGIDLATDIFEDTLPAIGKGLASFSTLISKLVKGDLDIGAEIQGIGDAILAFPLSIATSFSDWLTDVTGIDIAGGLAAWEGIKENLIGEGGILPSIVNYIWQDVIQGAIAGLVSTMAGIWESVKGPLEVFKTEINKIFTWIKDNVVKPLADAIQGVADALSSLGGGVQAAVGVTGHLDTISQHNPGDVLAAGFNAIGQELGFRASGGPVGAGRSYIVGERGPELFVPSRSGTIMPNGSFGGGAIVINAYGETPHEVLQLVERAARERDF